MSYVFHKGEYVNEHQAFIAKDNRAFRLGDGFFESMRVVDGKVLFLENHFSRISDTIKAYKMVAAENFNLDLLRNQIQGLLSRNNITKGGRIRITFYRKSTGYYLPHSDDVNYLIESEPLLENEFILNPIGKTVDIFTDFKKDVNKLSIYKSLNAQLYIMAALHSKEKNLDDALIQNNKFAIIESISSNIFIVSNGVLYTPSLTDGCIAGTMRMNIINIALDNKIKVYECTLNPQNLLAADEIFLTNAVKGIEWVVAYRTKRYYNDMSKKMIQLLNDAAKNYTGVKELI
ncbi:MAG: aminotransferase class IV [Flavobacteriales bacterium]|jgi:branched-subunit amino acid aminotransferase/4-amino-4-deoxychorismate lyase